MQQVVVGQIFEIDEACDLGVLRVGCQLASVPSLASVVRSGWARFTTS